MTHVINAARRLAVADFSSTQKAALTKIYKLMQSPYKVHYKPLDLERIWKTLDAVLDDKRVTEQFIESVTNIPARIFEQLPNVAIDGHAHAYLEDTKHKLKRMWPDIVAELKDIRVHSTAKAAQRLQASEQLPKWAKRMGDIMKHALPHVSLDKMLDGSGADLKNDEVEHAINAFSKAGLHAHGPRPFAYFLNHDGFMTIDSPLAAHSGINFLHKAGRFYAVFFDLSSDD